MGASLAIRTTDTLPDIKAVVVDSGPLLFVKGYFQYVLSNKAVKNGIVKLTFLFIYLYIIGFYKESKLMIKRLKKLKDLPILIVHSKTDKIIPYKDAQLTHSLIPSDNCKLITVGKGHHLTNRIILGKAYDKIVLDFFNKWMVNDDKKEREDY